MDFGDCKNLRIVWGNNCIDRNAQLFGRLGKYALIVTGKNSARKSGALADVINALERNSVRYKLFEEVVENPTLSVAEGIGEAARKFGADFLVGIGGGSALDATRAGSIFAVNKFRKSSDVYKCEFEETLPFVCVGTTAGTGSEVDSIAIISEDGGKKRSIKNDKLYAWFSFCDPKYTLSMSYRQTVSTALDAFCHCLESWFSKASTEESREYAAQGAALIYPNLVKLVGDRYILYNKRLREELYYGSLWGGLAIDIAGTGFPHPCGYVLTETCGVPHGIATAVFENAFLRHSLNELPEERDRLFETIGAGEKDIYDTITALTKNNIRISKELCDEIGERLKTAPATERTLGEFSWEEGKQLAEIRFLDRRLLEKFSGRWTL